MALNFSALGVLVDKKFAYQEERDLDCKLVCFDGYFLVFFR